MWMLWGGIALQVVSALIFSIIIESLRKPYSILTGGHIGGLLIGLVFFVFGVTAMLMGLKKYFLGDITELLKKLADGSAKPQ